MILRFFVIRQDFAVTPPFDAEISPPVMIATIGTAIDHGVDRTRSTEQFAARPENFPAIHLRLFFRLIGPITLGFEELWESGGDLNILLFVRATGFEQDDFHRRVFR